MTTAPSPAPGAPGLAVGNYFIANYPPFSFWRPERVGEALEALGRPGAAGVPLGLYLHIPFCRLRCKFCYFRVYTEKSAREVEEYVEALAREVELYRSLPAVEGRALSFVYFGGGTPSYLSTAQLTALAARLKAALSWDRAEEVTFECEPGTLTRKKLEVIRALGVTRLSLGVENFDDGILELNGRAHRSPEIYRSYQEARQAGFPEINVDLIAGLAGETAENWARCVRETARLAPESVTIYPLELPYNTEFSRELLHGGAPPPMPGWEEKRAWVRQAFEELERAGYRVKSGYTLARAGSPGRFVYRDALWQGADLIGAGVASFSHLNRVHFQNADRFEEYIARLMQGELPLARALTPTPRELLIRELILQMKLGEVDAGYFRRKFGVEVREEFREPFAGLHGRGLLGWQGDRLVLTREGLLQVDGLLPELFLPEHRGARYT